MIRSLRPLAHREFRLLTGATLISVLGDGLMRVALPLQVLAISGDDPLAIGLVGFAWATGHATSLPAGGLVSDRVDRRVVMIASDLVRAAAIGAIGLLGVLGTLRVPHVLALGALFGFANGFFNPAARSVVPDLLPDAELPRGNALLASARPLQLWIVGPLLAGVIIGLSNPGVALLIDGLSFVVSAALLGRLAPRPTAAGAMPRRGRVLDDVREGVWFLRHHRWALILFVVVGLSTLAFHGPFDVLVPTMLKTDLGLTEAEAAWWIAATFAAGGVGALLASALIAQRDLPPRFMTVLYGAESATLFGMAAFAVVTRLWHALIAGAVVFGANVLAEIIEDTTIQRGTPRSLLGRVIGMQWFVAIGLAPVSFALAGPLGRAFGPRPVLGWIGVVGGVLVLCTLLVPGARTPERAQRHDEPASELVTS